MSVHLALGHSALLPAVSPGLVSMVLIPAVLVAFAVIAIRQLMSATRPGATREGLPVPTHQPTAVRTPEAILADRLARGEITAEEYRRALNVIRS